MLRRLRLPPADSVPQSARAALERRIREQVKALKYDDRAADDCAALVRDWNLIALSQKLVAARRDREGSKLTPPEVAAIQQDVAKTLARLIEAVILPVDDMEKGHDLAEVLRDKAACCQGDALLYYVLGNAIGLSVEGLDVTFVAGGPKGDSTAHDACLVRLADGLSVTADVTRNLGHREAVSKPFGFAEAYRPCGDYWEIKDSSNRLGLHRVVRPLDLAGLLAQLCDVRASRYMTNGNYEQASAAYSEALRIDPHDADAYRGRGMVRTQRGRYDQAIADCTAALWLNPRDADSYSPAASPMAARGRATRPWPTSTRPSASTRIRQRRIDTAARSWARRANTT